MMVTLAPAKQSIDTPALIIDQQQLIANIKKMQAFADSAGVSVRPHCKTHKCTEIARLQKLYGAIGVCATKISEAEQLVRAGVEGVLITSPVVTDQKIERLMALLSEAHDLMVVVDSLINAGQLNEACQKAGVTLNCLVDIDPGVHRTGVSYKEAIVLAQIIHEHAGLNLAGIQCYAGNLQHIHQFVERQQASSAAMVQAATIRQSLISEQLPCPVLSGTGTGTFDIDSRVEGVTEIQPGSYAVMDQEYANIEGHDSQPFNQFSHAMTLLTTVISANHNSHVTVDAGLKSLYIDNTRPKIISHPGLEYDWAGFGDEHGKVTAQPGVKLPVVGEVLEIVVPHCDPTINLFNEFYVVDEGKVVARWPINLRGCSQ